ncbi:hypothetical protein COW36_00665 [bacterium (Candidatus Blackallbacteria) CG17_big_fil_post_rev_8_21_14_2_50_48_46]|uniref:Uncharacterized protein n=1 Tax=bacterium (Candidatus Blackallbacteria) CG17_big_fil_post_rev_8_21_14_2_50_48_46 TaxID=2014261 RepID=A0A2M7GBS6_9BACT|nr:MAG: hypothetical protein COW64_10510 [bacterium (Candidatus Blackallbacteria) CG18_big_fil_WC_8_21_14_2_50_49_26]PIW19383.1 MAG: hypothetical protein COW36_00665 [bacterium (Candidatus Blackallbacteria) CG17_big_fil_post_rev_8_21_14_2_50_48_46]PIW49013.1 MAG: hypothetical protein COW20_07790 [bacterium (Candidatus Blackallbacteria) CG13_big_fil_rev_8_21_14_2_50_49_14]
MKNETVNELILNRSIHRLLGSFMLCSLLVACGDIPAESVATPSASAAFQDQIDVSAGSTALSVRNALNQARNAFLQISGRLQFVSPDLEAYQNAVDKVLPAMVGAANTLTTATASTTDNTTDMAALKEEFQQLYSDALNQMLNGINLNLQIYQNQYETPQSLSSGATLVSAEDALKSLSSIFQITEATERYLTELAAFDTLFTQQQPKQALDGLRNQQTVVMNGIFNFSAKTQDTQTIKNAYQMVAKSIVNPALLTQFSNLAIRAYGEEQVAYRKEEVTPNQSNPNRVVMVVREDGDHYRSLQIESGTLKNQLVQDSRGLRAADFLNQSNIVVVTPSPKP